MSAKLVPGQALGPEWRVEVFQPGERLVLRKDTASDRARARSTAIIALGSLACAVALAAETPDGLRLVTWPVAGLLLLVTALAVPAAVRSARRAWLGVTVEATRDGVTAWPVPRGILHDLRAGPRRCPAADVVGVEIRTTSHPPLVLSMLELRLVDGTRLAGPEVAVPETAAPPLDAAADALRQLVASPRGR